METQNIITDQVSEENRSKQNNQFITANTIESSLAEIKAHHIIPVFVKTNEPVISQVEFIECVDGIVKRIFGSETIAEPQVRVSHPIKGRIPEAKDKPASKLKDHEKTIFYERAAFVIEIPSIQEEIEGNRLSLTVGGVKCYHPNELYNRTSAEQHFKVFIGFKNMVCTNLCISTDGYLADLKVRNIKELQLAMECLIANYIPLEHLTSLKRLAADALTERQFAQLIGRCRMYPYLSRPQKIYIGSPGLQLTDTQLGTVVKDYYSDENFSCQGGESLSLWRLYNLLTGANKTTYIDSFLDRGVNSYNFIRYLQNGLAGKSYNWYLQ